jgi:hypothetical protein
MNTREPWGAHIEARHRRRIRWIRALAVACRILGTVSLLAAVLGSVFLAAVVAMFSCGFGRPRDAEVAVTALLSVGGCLLGTVIWFGLGQALAVLLEIDRNVRDTTRTVESIQVKLDQNEPNT